MNPSNTEEMKQGIRVSFDEILKKCNTVGDLQKLDEEVRKLNTQMTLRRK